MLILIGTLPYKTGLYIGKPMIHERSLMIGSDDFSIERGTAAMAASACKVLQFYGKEMPLCIFGGDIADGKGTDLMFREVNSRLEQYAPDVVTLHYLFPKINYGLPFFQKINSLPKRPQLIADAGGMYLMKSIGKANMFDVFTPDQGELYFLADAYAPHPLYVRSELLNEKFSVESLMEKALKNKNTAKTTVVKGATDYIYHEGHKVAELSTPNIPSMEAVGGTGDTITGMLSALRFCNDPDADLKALRLNRLIGQQLSCTPATQIAEFINQISRVLEDYEKQIR